MYVSAHFPSSFIPFLRVDVSRSNSFYRTHQVVDHVTTVGRLQFAKGNHTRALVQFYCKDVVYKLFTARKHISVSFSVYEILRIRIILEEARSLSWIGVLKGRDHFKKEGEGL